MANKRVVRVLNVDLLRVLAGREMTFSDNDGDEVVIRLFTADEFLDVQHALVEQCGHGEKVTAAKAAELTRSVDLLNR